MDEIVVVVVVVVVKKIKTMTSLPLPPYCLNFLNDKM